MYVTRVIIIYLISITWSLLAVAEDTPHVNQTVVNVPPLNISTVAEGGALNTTVSSNDTTHMGREHMLTVIQNKVTPVPLAGHMIKVTHPSTVKPPAFEVPEKNDDKKSVPKKGVSFPDNKNTTTNMTRTTTVKPKKKKPLFTEADHETFVPEKIKSNDTVKHAPGIEAIMEQEKKPDYVVPIVVVILLVPLVAIIISVLYKRGAEWWQHRHYRRMDFLIEGMYNN